MKKAKIKIQSVSDIITNSSSEVYLIKTEISKEQLREMWDRQLEEWKVREEKWYHPSLEETYRGEVRVEEDGRLCLAYDVLCNVDQNIEAKLKEWFGEENVEFTE